MRESVDQMPRTPMRARNYLGRCSHEMNCSPQSISNSSDAQTTKESGGLTLRPN